MKIIKTLCLFLILSPFTYCGLAVLSGGDVGGGGPDLEVMQAFVNQASTGNRTPNIGVITAGVSWSTAEKIAGGITYRFKTLYGVPNAEWIPFHVDNGNSCTSSEFNSKLYSLTGIYFNGGDTELVMRCFFPNGRVTSALSIIQSRYRSESLALFASSAGVLAVQATSVLGTRESWGSIQYGSDYDSKGGFGLFTFGFLDVHFSQRGRMGRLIRMVLDRSQESTKGFGIDENTSMVVEGDRVRVLGNGAVYVVHVNEAIIYSGKTFAVDNVKVSRLTKYDSYNVNTGTFSWGYDKSTLTSSRQNGYSASTSSNLFSPNVFATISVELFKSRISSSTFGLTSELYPRYKIEMRKTSSSSGAITSGDIERVSYRNMYVDIACYANC